MSKCSIVPFTFVQRLMPSQSPYNTSGIHHSYALSKSSLTSSCQEPQATDISHQLPFKSPLVSRGKSKAKPTLTGPPQAQPPCAQPFGDFPHSAASFFGLVGHLLGVWEQRSLTLPGKQGAARQKADERYYILPCRKLSLPFPQD